MITLGIETSCDETSVAVIKDGRKILSNVVYSSLKEHAPFGGVIPEIASRSHLETLPICLDRALKAAKIKIEQVDLIAVTQGPGLMGSLLVGLSAAKSLALALNKPLVGVDHVIAHAYAGFLVDPKLKFPIIGLTVSGGHTLILLIKSPSQIQVLGRTIDDAAGEAFDKVAKMLELGYPGGPEVDRMAAGRDSAKIFFKRPILSKDSYDFSFSGIKTAVHYKVAELRRKKKLSPDLKGLICSGFQESVCDVLVEKTLRAAKSHQIQCVVVGGGVSANRRLRQKFSAAGGSAYGAKGIRVIFPSLKLCQDNAAMIAALGTALYKEGRRDTLELSSYSNFTDGGVYVDSGK